ncbi:MAG: leucine-rich repeat domain-containing protein [Flagellimonas sp.]
MRLKVILTIMLLGGLLWGNAQVTPGEKQALQDLYNATNGPNWASETDGFLGDEWDFDGNVTNDWYGVTVDNGHVVQLNLESNGLEGILLISIGDLMHLTYLNLSANSLMGSIPPEIGNMANLETLDLLSNSFNGELPASFGNLASLKSLYLAKNGFNGVIPPEIVNQLPLTDLQIEKNQFDFGNLEYTYQNYNGNDFTYSPQQKTDQPEIFQIVEGEDITLTTEISGTQNHYQWFKDGQPINGAPDSPEYDIVGASLDDIGTYHCEMTSDIVQGLTLVRHNIELTMGENPEEPEAPEEDWNTITVWSYDMDTNLKGNTRSYYNDLGKNVQTQSWDVVTNTMWAQATLYDYQGRAALSTLSAPIPGQGEFHYHESFITNEDGTAYATADFDMHPFGPDQVFEDGPLGKYYSGITSDQYQDITAYPFSSTIFSELNPGTVLSAVGGNKVDTNGDEQITPADQWPQAYSFTMPATDELSLKVAFGKASYATVQTQKTIVRDVHGNESVVFVDTDGKLLAKARSGEEGVLSPSMDLYIGAQGYVDVHIPKGVNSGILISNEGAVSLYNLITDAPEPTAAKNLPPGFYRVSVNDKDNYVPNKIFVSYQVNYYDYSLNEYDEAGRLVASYQPLTDENDEKLATTYKYNALGQIVWVSSPDEGNTEFKYRNDGQIRYSQNSKQADDKEVSYTDYDTFGRPVESGVLTQLDFKELKPDKPLPQANKKETMATTYDFLDNADYAFLANLDPAYQHPSFLAGNVAKTANENTTTYYSYDGYGRVKWLVQDINGLGAKTIDYGYEPLTGLVQKVIYQKGQEDQFVHRYAYNERDQLVQVETSVDDNDFTVHAKYLYNDAGTLVRTEIADGAQGQDYVYTLAGQLKSINHPSPGH